MIERKGDVFMISLIGYVALFFKTKDKYYAEFPDLPGCYSQGDSLEQAIYMAQNALTIYYQEKKGELPTPTDIQIIQQKNPDRIAQMIIIDHVVKPLRSVKKTLTIPEWLNILAEKYNLNFSKVLKNALISQLDSLDTLSEHDRRLLND